ncbi:MAG: T9SS type A sorting domain-containing protein [Flavobacteriales bacterium]|nr:T9SS type A sorting domain-containing protein [Flavobacteriales bacterium]
MKKLILSLLLAVSANALHAQSICFDPNDDVRYDAGDGPNAVAVADFNEDQHKDGVAANYLEGSVSIFIGNGDGTFQPQLVIGGFNGSAEDVKVGDFNNDQHDDILVCLRGTGDNLTFIPGNGDGTFGTAVTYALGLNPSLDREIELADVDGDNLMDVMYSVQQDSAVYALKSMGNGTFNVLDTLTDIPNKIYDITMGDINGDTHADIAIGYSPYTTTVSYYLGNGDGSFGAENTVTMAYSGPNTNCVLAHLNGDNYYDLVAETFNRMYIWTGDAQGNLTFQTQTNIVAQPDKIFVGNVDDTGFDDVAWVISGSGSVGSLINTSQLAATVAPRSTAFGSARSGVLADFDEDGLSDMFTACYGEGYITLLKGNGDGTFGPVELRTDGFARGLVAEDFDGDNHKDIITASSSLPYQLSFMKGVGDGSFLPTVHFPTSGGASDIKAIDVDGDLDLDIAIVTNGGNLLILHNDGSGNFADEDVYTTPTGGGDRWLTVGYFNNDLLPDLAFCHSNGDAVYVFMNSGSDSFTGPFTVSTGSYPSGIASDDFNGDGFGDVVVSNDQSNSISVRINNQTNGFLGAVDYSTGANPRSITITDFNNDQELDLVVVNNGSSSISFFAGNGDGTFQAAQNTFLGTGTIPGQISWALINGDSEKDLLISYPLENKVALLTGNGDGTFDSPQTFSTDNYPEFIALGDFNEDNAMDISALNFNTQNVSVILNSSAFIEASGSTQLCEGESVTLSATGGFSYLWSTGATTPSIDVDESGNYTVTITNQVGDCDIIPAGVEVTVNLAPNVNLNPVFQADLCITDDEVALVGGSPQGGDYSGPEVVNGIFNPSAAGLGQHVLYYTYTDPAQCFTLTDSATYTVYPDAEAFNNFPFETICIGADPIPLAQYGSPSGGEWTILSQTQTQVTAQDLGVGMFPLHYVVENEACLDTATVMVEVMEAVPASFTLSTDTLCMNYGTLELTTGTPAGGYYFGPGVNNNQFDPMDAGAGTFSLAYGYDEGVGCADTAYVDIEVLESPEATLTSSYYYFCIDDFIEFAQLTGQPAGGVYFGPGVNGNEFDPAEANEGTHEIGYAYENAEGCSDTAFIEIEVDLCPNVAEIDHNAMQVYPNPAKDVFTVSFRDASVEGMLEIRDMLGRLVHQEAINGVSSLRLEATWPAGNYQLMLLTDEFIGVERLITTK